MFIRFNQNVYKERDMKRHKKEKKLMKQGGVKCRTYKARIYQKLSRIRSRLNLPSKDDFVYSKNYGSGIPAFVLGEPKKT